MLDNAYYPSILRNPLLRNMFRRMRTRSKSSDGSHTDGRRKPMNHLEQQSASVPGGRTRVTGVGHPDARPSLSAEAQNSATASPINLTGPAALRWISAAIHDSVKTFAGQCFPMHKRGEERRP